MNKYLPAALFTARQYAKKYQEGGEVEGTRPPAPPPKAVTDDDAIAPPAPPFDLSKLLGMQSWWDQAAEESRKNQEAFAKEGARGMLRDTEGTQELAGGFSDAGILGTTKPVAGVAGNVAKNLFHELAPEAVGTAQKIPLGPGHAPGSQGGGMFTGFWDNINRYIKPAKSEDHALNERLGAALYKELGVPSADVELTQVNGKPHISSPQVPGVQLGASNYHPHNLMDLQQGLPADQFLAGYDSVGLNRDNIIVDNNGVARRIDFGGTMRYRAQGAPKAQWGSRVVEFNSFFDPSINPQAASSFVPYGKNAAIDAARKEMAGRIANLSDDRINNLVAQYGPHSPGARIKLANELKSRRDQVADFYGVQKAPPVPEEGGPTLHPHSNESGASVTINNPHTPSPTATWTDPKAVATFIPGDLIWPDLQLNHAQLKRYKPWNDWASAPGTLDEFGFGAKEPPFEKHPSKNSASGVVIVEPDGRIWLRSPTNEYGGVKNGFPKGTKDKNLNLQQNAIKDAFEETGLKVQLLKHLADVEGATSKTRYYLARRESGHPGDMGWESQAVHLAPHAEAAKMLNMPADQQVLKALQGHNALHELLPKTEPAAPREISLKDPKKDAETIMHNEKGDPTNVAEVMYNIAAKSGEHPEYVDKIYQHLPQHIQADVNDELTMLISKHGDPWKDEFHNIGHVEPTEGFEEDPYQPLTEEDWERHLNESVPPLQANSQHLEYQAYNFLLSKGLDPTHPEERMAFHDPVQSAIGYGWEPPLVPKKPPAAAADVQQAKDYLEFLGHDPKDPDDKYLFADPIKWAESTGLRHNTLFKSLQKEEKVSPPPANVPKVMQINKTHSPNQIVHALKDYGKATALQQPGIVTAKQVGKIEQLMAAKQPEALATEMAGLTHDQISNLYSWMPQKHIDSVGDSLYDLAAKGKAYKKGPDQYQKDLKEYYDNQDKHAQHEEALYTGEPALPKPALKPDPLEQKFKQQIKKSYTDQEWMKTLFKDIPDWSKYRIRDSHQFVPLDIPKAQLTLLQQQHGFNPMKIFHSSGEFGPNKQELYPSELWHPTKKQGEGAEQAFFGSTHPHIAGGYHGKPVALIARGNKTAEFDWSLISSYGGYNLAKMQAVIAAGRAKGYDLVVVRNIHDIGSSGPQVQFLILEPEILRAPTAKFDPTKLHKAWPLAGVVGGFTYTYGSMPGEQRQQGQMAKGGKVMPLRAGSSKKVVSQNISEFHTGKTYAHTASKFGKERANKQAIAVALSTARKYGKGKAAGGPAQDEPEPPLNPTPSGFGPLSGKEPTFIYPSTSAGFKKDKLPPSVARGPYGVGSRASGGKALGGPNISMENMVMRSASAGLRHEGMIHSSVPGRTDKLLMKVRSGSYILPADIPSALGQGNTMAGGEILKKMFSSGPYGLPTMKSSGASRMPRPMSIKAIPMPKKLPGTYAKGGAAEDEHVPIVAAGGEYIIHPDVVRDVGHGDIKTGHKVLDKFVLDVRKKNIKTLKELPGPKR